MRKVGKWTVFNFILTISAIIFIKQNIVAIEQCLLSTITKPEKLTKAKVKILSLWNENKPPTEQPPTTMIMV